MSHAQRDSLPTPCRSFRMTTAQGVGKGCGHNTHPFSFGVLESFMMDSTPLPLNTVAVKPYQFDFYQMAFFSNSDLLYLVGPP